MIILAIAIFITCLWAVFSKHFCDGIITKHCLAFAAITAMLVIRDPGNTDAMITALVLFFGGFGYWFYKHYNRIREIFDIVIH